jgi:hypothetical protein
MSDDDWLNDDSGPGAQILANQSHMTIEAQRLFDLAYGVGYKEARDEYIPKNFIEGVIEGHALGHKSGIIEGKIDACLTIIKKIKLPEGKESILREVLSGYKDEFTANPKDEEFLVELDKKIDKIKFD